SSDNIPGLPKVGEKTAQAMLQGIPSIDKIYEDIDAVTELGFRGAKSMPKKLEEFKDQLLMSRELATIKCDVELECAPDALTIEPADTDQLQTLYGKMEFRRWLNELLETGAATDQALGEASPAEEQSEQFSVNRDAYKTLFNEEEVSDYIEQLKSADVIAFDTETTSLNYMEAQLVGVSFSIAEGEAVYIPVAHDYVGVEKQVDRDWLLKVLKPLLEDSSIAKVGQNLKYDAHILRRYGIKLRGIKNDTMLASYVFNSVGSRHDMDTLSLQYLNHKPIKFEEIAGKGAKQLTFNQIELAQAAPYAAEDADITLRLHHILWDKVHQTGEQLASVLTDIEVPLVSILTDMEEYGVKVDAEMLGKQSEEIANKLDELEQKAFEIAGEEFNLGSPKQLQQILFEKLELPVIKKTPKGAPSTAEEVLQELAHDYSLPDVILQHRSLAKLKSTYTDKLPRMINPDTGRVHTSYQQAVAATGRLSSTEPNLQNIPIRTPEGRRVRQAFVAEEGFTVVAIDYSQIELRIMAHLSQDASLLRAFAQGQDIHRATASEVFGCSLEEVTDEQRRRAKAVNFGLIYGMSAFGLSRQLDIPRHEAQAYMDKYFERFPGVLEYMENTRETAKKQGYVSTLFGRRLPLPEIKASNGARRKAAERAAINAPMQGTAADIIKRAMIKVGDWIDEKGCQSDVRMLMQVHDELVFEIRTEHAESYAKALADVMGEAADLDVPLLAEYGFGANWDEAH
ncbi:MAG: DNA polymerase I, partial [Pseudomonadota bacterium]|nr:DNA polymerase I [Pseudomonadota bacterium]